MDVGAAACRRDARIDRNWRACAVSVGRPAHCVELCDDCGHRERVREAERHVELDGAVKEHGFLWHDRHVGAELGGGHRRRALPCDADRAARRCIEALDQAHGRRLARAALADEGGKRACRDVERDATQRRLGPLRVREPDVVERDGQCTAWARLRRLFVGLEIDRLGRELAWLGAVDGRVQHRKYVRRGHLRLGKVWRKGEQLPGGLRREQQRREHDEEGDLRVPLLGDVARAPPVRKAIDKVRDA